MPIYEYSCEKCGNEFEELVFDSTAPNCPKCGQNKTRRLMSRPARYSGGNGGEDAGGYSGAGSSGGCSGCSGGNCASCGH